ncbi:hypothetical protein B0H14DRAFT_2655488 [Mycena olivaceomarginata]|nr:hypothetical protein B0H14DRAFT_2655488 [Mycena olivaceomarginata]
MTMSGFTGLESPCPLCFVCSVDNGTLNPHPPHAGPKTLLGTHPCQLAAVTVPLSSRRVDLLPELDTGNPELLNNDMGPPTPPVLNSPHGRPLRCFPTLIGTHPLHCILAPCMPRTQKVLKGKWQTHYTINVTSPFTNTTLMLAQYSVSNSTPRPKSYLQDYTTVHDPMQPTLNNSQATALYAELASSTETG